MKTWVSVEVVAPVTVRDTKVPTLGVGELVLIVCELIRRLCLRPFLRRHFLRRMCLLLRPL